jgi:hypothetical protein
MIPAHLTNLSPEEFQEYRDFQYSAIAPPSWVWNEEEVEWQPPFPPPSDNNPYLWDEENKVWELFPGCTLVDAPPQGEE